MLVLRGNKFIVENKVLPEAETIDVISGARTLKEMSVWKYLIKDMKHGANFRIFNSSTTTDDLIFGKAMLYCIDIMEHKIDNLSRVK